MVVSCLAVHTESSGCVASFPGPLPAFRNPWNEEAGEREHVLGVRICPVSTVYKWLTISKWWTIPMLNRKELEMQTSELLWSRSGTHTVFFFRLPCHCHVQQLFNQVNMLISKFFTRQTDRWTKPIAYPIHACTHGIIMQDLTMCTCVHM